jgi:DNA ligase-1
MLRKPESLYIGARSDTLLKVKSFTDDEAKVIEHATQGQGKYKDMAGSLVCVMRNGKRFKVGSGLTDQDRANPPAVGSIITVRYQELTKAGVPRFPTYVGPAIDKTFP